jgi:VCBS repeat-containing protein
MRYEDASGTDSFSANDAAQSSTLSAHNDADVILAGHFGPATGNTITGTGTVSGSAGADLIAAGHAHITAIQGAGGTDTTFSGGHLQIAGQYGVLTIDAEGNYSYVRNHGTPEGVSDVFNYTLSADDGATDMATLTINIGKTPLVIQANAVQVVPGPNGAVTLPAGVELSDIHVVGRNLVIDMPDGTQMVIVDGAVFVPQLVLGTVEVPSTNLAALLIDSEPQPAAGPPQSSGGNFEVPVSPLDPGVPLGDLIPPTELSYTPPEVKEIGQFINQKPEAGTAAVQLDDDAKAGGNPGGVGDDPDSVGTPGLLPGSGGDGNLVWDLLSSGAPSGFSYIDGPNGSILVQQVQGGPTVTVLTITVNPATGAYTVVQNAAILHAAGGDENNAIFSIGYTVTDSDGDTATGTLTVNVDDDTPTVTVTAGPDAEVILTTHDAATIGANSEAVSTSANFGGVFTGTVVSPGADGAGVGTSSGYALSTTGVSGLTQGGVAINLYSVGGVIVGSTAGTSGGITAANTVFQVSVNGTGVVTLTQFSQIDHTNTDPSPTGAPFTDHIISLTVGSITLRRSETVVDRDGD